MMIMKSESNIEKALDMKMVTCCGSPSLIFTQNVDKNRLEISCEHCGVSFWNFSHDCKHKIGLKSKQLSDLMNARSSLSQFLITHNLKKEDEEHIRHVASLLGRAIENEQAKAFR